MFSKTSLMIVGLLFSLGAEAQSPQQDSFKQLQRDYQILARDYQALLAEIYGKQADYWQLNKNILTDLNGLGELKNDSPFEHLPDDLIATAKRYADYALNLRDELRVFLGNADLHDRLTELDLRSQNLSFRGLALTRNQQQRSATLAPASPQTDFSELDKAIVGMDKEDRNHLDKFAGIDTSEACLAAKQNLSNRLAQGNTCVSDPANDPYNSYGACVNAYNSDVAGLRDTVGIVCKDGAMGSRPLGPGNTTTSPNGQKLSPPEAPNAPHMMNLLWRHPVGEDDVRVTNKPYDPSDTRFKIIPVKK